MSAETELAARMPWTVAQPESWWEVSGIYRNEGSFRDCLARVLPKFITGHDDPLFEVLIYGNSSLVPASSITRGRELMLVFADAPWNAYLDRDQASLDAALDAS